MPTTIPEAVNSQIRKCKGCLSVCLPKCVLVPRTLTIWLQVYVYVHMRKNQKQHRMQ